MTSLRDPTHIVFAAYGCSSVHGMFETFYDLGLKQLRHLGLRPTSLGIGSDKKLRSFSRADRKLRSQGFTNVDALNLFSVPETCKHELEGYSAYVMLHEKYRMCIVDFDLSVVRISEEELIECYKQVADLIEPSYGMGYRRAFHLGPHYYAMGLAHGPISSDETDEICGSFEVIHKSLYMKGVIRILCPWNLLNPSHLSAQIEGQCLDRWISLDNNRGTLAPFTKGLMLWRIHEDNIAGLKKPLYDAGILFDNKRYWQARQILGPTTSSSEDAGEGVPATGQPLLRETHTMDVNVRSPEEAIRLAMQAFGYDDPEEVDILKVEKPGELRQLSREEVEQVMKPREQNPKSK